MQHLRMQRRRAISSSPCSAARALRLFLKLIILGSMTLFIWVSKENELMTGHIATMQQLEELHNFFSVDSSSVNAQHNNDGGVVSAVNGRKPRETPLNQKIDVVKDNGRLPMSSVEYHIVFSTGCNAFQDCE